MFRKRLNEFNGWMILPATCLSSWEIIMSDGINVLVYLIYHMYVCDGKTKNISAAHQILI